MNTKLLRQVRAHILGEPRRLRMEHGIKPQRGKGAPPCGTVGCIAGWAVILANKKRSETIKDMIDRMSIPRSETSRRERSWSAVKDMATELLEIVPASADRLFYTLEWPQDLKDAYAVAGTAAGRARITARRIARFIKTKGRK